MNPPNEQPVNAEIVPPNEDRPVDANVEDLDDDDIDLLMLTAQEHDLEDECKRVHASQHKLVSSQPASRIFFARAKPPGARIVFAEDLSPVYSGKERR